MPQTCSKKGYKKKDAQTAVNARLSDRGHGRPDGLRIYECDVCRQWHITHRRGEGMKS
jgi:hypothetical protein